MSGDFNSLSIVCGHPPLFCPTGLLIVLRSEEATPEMFAAALLLAVKKHPNVNAKARVALRRRHGRDDLEPESTGQQMLRPALSLDCIVSVLMSSNGSVYCECVDDSWVRMSETCS